MNGRSIPDVDPFVVTIFVECKLYILESIPPVIHIVDSFNLTDEAMNIPLAVGLNINQGVIMKEWN